MENNIAFSSLGELQKLPQLSAPVFGDAEVVALWLAQFENRSFQTVRSYRSQAWKFRIFLGLMHPDWKTNTHFRQAGPKDVRDYEAALSHQFKDADTRRLVRLSPGELVLFGLQKQPFDKPMAQSSVNQALAVLNAMYQFMREPSHDMAQAYVLYNPVTKALHREARVVTQTNRYIPLEGVQAMHAMVFSLIGQAKEQKEQKGELPLLQGERLLWIFTLLFGLWGRRQELCFLSMASFRQNNESQWVVDLVRKGKKTKEEIPAAAWVVEGLRRYRQSLGLPREWEADDQLPAIAALRGRHQRSIYEPINPQTLYIEIKALAVLTAQAIAAKVLLPGISDARREALQKILKACSPHWFRHTGPSLAINNGSISIENASKILGHSSLDTTSNMYYHGEQKAMRSGLDALGEQLDALSDPASSN